MSKPIHINPAIRECAQVLENPELENMIVIYSFKGQPNLSMLCSQSNVAEIVFWLEQTKLAVIEEANKNV